MNYKAKLRHLSHIQILKVPGKKLIFQLFRLPTTKKGTSKHSPELLLIPFHN